MRYDLNRITENGDTVILQSFYSKVPAGKREYREHHHVECELSTIISGSGIYTVKNKAYPFKAGDVFLFSGDEPHCITDIAGEFVLLNIQFLPKLLWSNPDSLPTMRIFTSRSESFENRIDADNRFTPFIHGGIIAIADELKAKQTGYKLIAKNKLFEILITLIRHYGYVDGNASFTHLGNTASQISRAVEYIDANIEKRITLREIASEAAMSETYFSAVFKKLCGISPWEYITIRRVERAVALIEGTDCKILDVALRCGFQSASNFYKAFTRITGKQPSELRKNVTKTE